MKSLKSKLMAAGAMLMVSVVMLTSASFAWFTVSTTADASGINVTMTATENLEIAKNSDEPNEVTANDAGDEANWGSTITALGSRTVNGAATVTGTALQTVQYDTDGRTNGLVAPTKGTEYYTHDGKNVAALYNDIWLRSNVDRDLTPTVSGNGAFKAAFEVNGTVASTIHLNANEATRVGVILYIDGADTYASGVAREIAVTGVTINFAGA